MAKQLKEIEIPFGAKDSELCGWEYTIPEGMEATIVDNKIVVKKKESENERIRKNCIHFLELQKSHHASTVEIDECIAWLEKQGEESRRQRVEEAIREVEEKSKLFTEAHKGKTSEEILAEMRGEQKQFDEYEGLTDFERTLADICIGWIGKELGWKQYIKDNADALLRIAVEKFNSVQDAPFEQNPAWSEECKEAFSDICENCCGRTVELVKNIMQPKQEWSEEDEDKI